MIESPYRWRDWASKPEGITGDDLIRFISNDVATLPDGTQGPGLFFYLRGLHGENGKGRKDVIANVFRGTTNRMQNGYLLRDVVNKIDAIHFTSSEEIHTLGFLYENLLKEMRDAAGDSGEFYTPRPVVKFMVTVMDPKLGESILDPACGTGGFLVETFLHVKEQCKSVEDREILQKETILGGEAKTLPYMLAEMNLLLHGMEYPNVRLGNSLDIPLREIGDKDRVDIVLTNPPFGGAEEIGIKGNFPADMQTSETALLFLQLIMRRLKRFEHGRNGGRAGVIVPDYVLFGDGVAARIKEALLRDFNLHTIVRLPEGVFEPYTPIGTNILFFENGGPTEDIWFYEIIPPDGRKKYTKTYPLRFDEFGDCQTWWANREINDHAWKVRIPDIVRNDSEGRILSIDLDIRNPSKKRISGEVTPSNIIDSFEINLKILNELFKDISNLVQRTHSMKVIERINLGKIIRLERRPIIVDGEKEYSEIGIYSHGKGIFHKSPRFGSEVGDKKIFQVKNRDFILQITFAWEGAVALASPDEEGMFCSSRFPTFIVDEDICLSEYLLEHFKTEEGMGQLRKISPGSAGRNKVLNLKRIPEIIVPLPSISDQELVIAIRSKVDEINKTVDKMKIENSDLLARLLEGLD